MHLLMAQARDQALDTSCNYLSLYLVSSVLLCLGNVSMAMYDGMKKEQGAYVHSNSGQEKNLYRNRSIL